MDRYWNELYKQQQIDSIGKKAKKQRKPRQKKAAAEVEAEGQLADNAVMAKAPTGDTHVASGIPTIARTVQQQPLS